jgi:carbonic anhydrase/acetyltransferase-like protein (isoleucine patch superfamily)
MPFGGKYAKVASDAFVAPSAAVVGDVELHDGTSVWYNAVVRGDNNLVKVGPGSSVGERASLSTVASLESGFPASLTIGSGVFIGPGATLVSCIVESGAVIGENSVILEVNISARSYAICSGGYFINTLRACVCRLLLST